MTFLRQDLGYAFRLLRKSVGFTAAAVLTLALGVGANLTVFLILYGVLLRPLPFSHPERLVRLQRSYPNGVLAPAYSGTKFLFLDRSSRTLEAAAAYDYLPSNVNLVQSGEAVPLKALRTSADFFHVFGMEPALGRGFTAADALPHAAGVAVLSEGLWRTRFGGDPGILGKAITLGNQQYTVVGVGSSKFRLDARVDLWTPLPLAESAGDQSNQYNIVARMKPGVTRAVAADDLKRALLEMKDVYPALWNQYEGVSVTDFHDSLVGDIRPALEILMGAVGLLLAIVAANILSLLLTRSIARRREMSLRAALGASGWRILRQLLAENAVLCLIGGVAGVLLAQVAAPGLMRLSPLELPAFSSLDIDGPALGFAALLTLACAVLFSVVPALEARRTQLNDSLRTGGTQIAPGRHLAQKSLVVGEVAVSLVLLAGSALLLASFWKLMHVAPGFETARVLTFKNSFSNQQVATSAQFGQRLEELVRRAEALPGVEAAAAASNLPTQLVADLPFDIPGRKPNPTAVATYDEKFIPVTEHYFEALRVPVMAGRGLSAADAHGSGPVVVVNEEFAKRYFKGENAVGQHLHIGAMMGPGFEDPVREIVGVVGDVKQGGLEQETPGILYLPVGQIPDKLAQMSNGLLGTSWVVRLKTPDVDVTAGLRKIFMDNGQTPLLSVEPLGEVVSASLARQRFSMILLSAFGLISLLLGMAGLYGVMSYTVARQTREIGVRMAVGAARGDISRMVLRDAGLLMALGVAAGIAVSLAAAKLLGSLVFEIAPRDPRMLAAASGLLLATGLLAAWLPAKRAADTEPMQALRAE